MCCQTANSQASSHNQTTTESCHATNLVEHANPNGLDTQADNGETGKKKDRKNKQTNKTKNKKKPKETKKQKKTQTKKQKTKTNKQTKTVKRTFRDDI